MVKNVSVSVTPNMTSSTGIHIPYCNQYNNAIVSITPLPVCGDMRVSQYMSCMYRWISYMILVSCFTCTQQNKHRAHVGLTLG